MIDAFIPICALLISLCGLLGSIYYSNQNMKHVTDADLEKEIQAAKEEARRDQTINMKLDEALEKMGDTNKEVKEIKRDLSFLTQENVRLSHDIEDLQRRMGDVEKVMHTTS